MEEIQPRWSQMNVRLPQHTIKKIKRKAIDLDLTLGQLISLMFDVYMKKND